MMAFENTLKVLFTPEVVTDSRVLVLITAAVVAGVFIVVRRRSEHNGYYFWAAAFLVYAVRMAAVIAGRLLANNPYTQLVSSATLIVSALLLLGGNLQMLGSRITPRLIVLAALPLLVLDYYTTLRLGHPWFDLGAYCLLGAAGLHAATVFFRQQKETGRLVVVAGLLLWALSVGSAPFLSHIPAMTVVRNLVAAGCLMTIAVTTIISDVIAKAGVKYRSVLDGVSDAVFLVDLANLTVLDVNSAGSRLARRDAADLVGSKFLKLCPDLRVEGTSVLDRRKMFAAVFKPYNEFHFVRTDGTMLLCEGDTSLAQWQQQSIVMVRIREVGADKNVGQLVRRAEKMSSLGQLVAGVAHELNNPLAVVMGYSQILAKQQLPDETMRTNVQRIHHEAERAAKIVRDLLAFARPCEPQLAVVDVNQLICNVLDVRERDMGRNEVELRQLLQRDLPRTKADPLQIEQVLNNLITNAVHAMSHQRNARVLTVTSEATGVFIRVSISDSGCGIPPEIMARIFDPFFTTKPPGKGTGLGLSISHGILKEHHGKIWAESEVGKGATFHLELPIVPVEETAEVAPPTKPTVESSSQEEQRRLLIVDDEPGIRDVLEVILTSGGYSVSTANNGAEAMILIKSNKYDLVISDMCMPEMDGEKLYEAISATDPNLAKRILFVTGDTVSAKSRTFLERTGNRWLSKPFNIKDVEEVVHSYMREKPKGAAAVLAQLRN
jgi:signal transduction histidine kinase/CheY-like chemotaxis protein